MRDNNGKEDFARLLINDSLVPDIFLVRYAQELSKNALLVYLWINMLGKKAGFDENDVKVLNIISEDEISQTLAELMSAGLINRKDKTYSFDDIKAYEVGEYIQTVKARGDNPELPGLMSDEKDRNVLANSISSTFYQGMMPYIFYRLIDKCLFQYKFDAMVLYKLFEAGRDQKIHLKLSSMEKMALSWYQKGYTDIKSLERQLEIDKRTQKLIKLAGKTMRKRLNGMEIERISSWAEDLDATEEMVTLAFKANEFRSNLTLANVGDTLKKWHDQGVKTVEDAVKFEEEEHKENKRKATRRKGTTGASWRTGAEAGIGETQVEAPKAQAVSKEDDPDDSNIPDDILDMFGDSDEDN